MRARGYPAYTTSAGWLGYSDEMIRRLVHEGLDKGWTHFKMKVGANLDDDVRRAQLIRDEIGPARRLMMDANQVWDVGQAFEWMKELARFRPLWIEEPTSPDDVLGHAAIARAVAPIGVATGEACQNRVSRATDRQCPANLGQRTGCNSPHTALAIARARCLGCVGFVNTDSGGPTQHGFWPARFRTWLKRSGSTRLWHTRAAAQALDLLTGRTLLWTRRRDADVAPQAG